MNRYVIRTKLLEEPNKVLFYQGTDKDEQSSFALNTIVAFNISEARTFDKARAFMLCEKLNADKESLIANGYSEFEVVMIGQNSTK